MAGRQRKAFWAGKRVLVTGHTGFIGGWLAHALVSLGAKVSGYADAVPTTPSLFEATGLSSLVSDNRGDIANAPELASAVRREQPEIVFHLAAQPLVRRAFKQPFETYQANLMGTLAMLESLRQVPGISAAVFMTTDKVYLNKEWAWPYRETDELGGHEPYGLSKAMAEMAIAQYRETYFSKSADGVAPKILSVRAGNVFGGGDWSEDRLVPDAVRAWDAGQPLVIRSPKSTRPWQHVLEVADGLLMLAERAASPAAKAMRDAYNIGPDAAAVVPVGQLVQMLAEKWGKGADVRIEPPAWQAPESQLLAVDSTLLRADFGWQPQISLPDGLGWTIEWYRSVLGDPASARAITLKQISELIDVSH
jgi:CDP-glucose 4,6-dehydratase